LSTRKKQLVVQDDLYEAMIRLDHEVSAMKRLKGCAVEIRMRYRCLNSDSL
jgi:hypothetical protein